MSLYIENKNLRSNICNKEFEDYFDYSEEEKFD